MKKPIYENFSKDELEEILTTSKTIPECLKRLGYSQTYTRVIKKIAEKYNIDISHLSKEHNLIGQTFGRLTVIAKATPEEIQNSNLKKSTYTYWKCICSCPEHNIKICSSHHLTQGNTKSCGCLIHEQHYNDLTGQKFGHLTVLGRDKSDLSRVYWKCQCDCSQQTILKVDGNALKNGHTKSCGCSIVGDLYNQRFGMLTVVDRDYTRGPKAYWLCKCDCGNPKLKSVSGPDLRAGTVQSCGCLKSRGELKVRNILNSLQIEFLDQYSFEDLTGKGKQLKFDFYLPDQNILIEYQGSQHYESFDHFGGEERLKTQQEYDSLKRDYCESHNIKLIEIPYWDYNKLNEDYLLSLINS